MKACTRCKAVKDFSAFYKDSRLRSGLASRCKECSAELGKEWFAKNAERSRETNKLWQMNNREKYRNNEQKRRARKRQAGEFVVTANEMRSLYGRPCFYCGSTAQITVDHVLPIARGGRHSIGNLIPACKPCNMSKHKKTIMEWKVRRREQQCK